MNPLQQLDAGRLHLRHVLAKYDRLHHALFLRMRSCEGLPIPWDRMTLQLWGDKGTVKCFAANNVYVTIAFREDDTYASWGYGTSEGVYMEVEEREPPDTWCTFVRRNFTA